ncbi:MAG: N-6 DNA methylase, partial [Phycisphaerae bacterium]|nr:N-6 DNA methylase [Phycisphaerae bacterium]
RLDDWLNGAVFPIDFRGPGAPSQEHIRWIAGVFAGEDILADGGRQLHFDFARYNFKYIPIETLSVIYEQFLHASDVDDKPRKGDSKKSSRGREAGACYTPLPVVNLMLAEMEDRLPLKKGMKILDPSCGSGAFLVQCYRRLIEKELPAGRNRRYALPELRKLLEDHIFGVDRDGDACSVTELSLTLTLLDYIHPPDLNGDKRRKLPSLRGRNIFCADFFDDGSPCDPDFTKRRFEWIVGNPPWKKLKSENRGEEDLPVLSWIKDNEKQSPVGNREVARAFAWKVADYLVPYGEIALLLPAMSLFEKAAQGFRAAFFKRMKVHAVANFANLAEVLFVGRSRVPAAAFFYRDRTASESFAAPFSKTRAEECITAYSPLVANQEPTRPTDEKTRNETWSLVINASEIRDIPVGQVLDGNGLPWKLATWGSHLDERFLAKLARRYPSLGELEDGELVVLSQGLELRRQQMQEDEEEQEEVEYVEEVIGKRTVAQKLLKKLRDVFVFPPDSIREVDPALCYARKGRAQLPLSVCQPPHVIVSAARLFAVYMDEYLIVPPRQIGIISPSKDNAFLKALSLFLSSDFAFYHQFLTSTQFGVQRGRATLDALRRIPIPLTELGRAELRDWTKLHSELVHLPPRRMDVKPNGQMELPYVRDGDESKGGAELIRELNNLTNDSLGLDSRERVLVHDLKHVRLELNDGKLGRPAVRSPKPKEMCTYARRLKSELDAFIGNELPKRHSVEIVYDKLSAMICVNLTKDTDEARRIIVERAGGEGAKQLERTRRRLRQKFSQWVYFDRNLRLYEGTRTYLFKPMQRFHWTESQAMFDAGEIIGEVLTGRSGGARC